MGAEMHCESYMPGFHSMENLNEDSCSGGWPLFFGDKAVANGRYYNGFMQRNSDDGWQGREKDSLKRKMLEHEAVFQNQVFELHRLYRIQRDMMDEVKRKGPRKHRASMEPASSSSVHGSRLPLKDGGKWHMAGFSVLNPCYDRTPVSEVKFVNSPVSCTEGNAVLQLGQLPFQNGSASKHPDTFDSRPLKARKKLFDLHLPAEEYMDTEEGESDYRIDASASASCLNRPVGLAADLNDPVLTEEASAPSSVKYFSHASENEETKRINEPIKSNAGNLGMVTVGKIHQPLPSHAARDVLSEIHHPGYGYAREDPWKEVPHHGLESNRNHSRINNSSLEPVASWMHGSLPFSFASFSSSRDNCQPGQVWAKPATTFAQNATTFEVSSSSAAMMNGSFHPTAQSRGPFGKWQVNTSSQLNALLGSESKVNNFHQASTSVSKGLSIDLPLAGVCNLNCSRVGDQAPDHSSSHQIGATLNGFCQADSKPATVINFNEALSKSSSNEIETTGKIKHKDSMPTLSWLKPKPTHVNHLFATKVGMLVSSDSEVGRKIEISEMKTVKKILGFPIFDKGFRGSDSSSVGCHLKGKNSDNERKHGVIDINVACEPDDQTAAEELTVEMEKKKAACVRAYIDLNISISDCEDPPVPCYDRNCAGVLEIDLEAPVFPEGEDDDTVLKENSPRDVSLMSLEDKDEHIPDVVLRNAADTITAMSLSCPRASTDDNFRHMSETSLEESVQWFADAVSYAKELEKIPNLRDGSPQQDYSDRMDDFEAMTLQLEEAKEEDHMPQPFVPEVNKQDNKGTNTAPNRSRRGPSRRGRQRRDFQRDTLPSLATLARHEVTEDIQTFGGLMRASGHHWSSGLTRRNGGTRGRRRAVVETVPTATPIPVCAPVMQQFSVVEAGLEERSLTGWGKTTTRRARRQRCPAGNPQPAAVLT